MSFQHKLDNPKIMGGPTDTPISFGEDGIDPYQASVTYLSVIREGVAAREVAERPDVDQVRWGEPARDLIKERISPDELGSKHEPVAVDIIGVKGDLNDNPRFDLAEGKGNDLKLYQLDDNAWRLRPPGGQGGENIDRLDVYVPDGAIDKINQNSQMTNLRVNETAGILETRRDGSGLWQPRLVPELPGKPGEYSPSGKSVHVWEVKIESNPDQNARKPGERDSVQEDHETVQDTTPKESLEGEQPLREKVQNKVSEIGDKVRARIAAIDDRAREISDRVRDQASEIGSKLTVGIATVSVAANLAGWTAIDLQPRESTTSITPIAQVEKTDPPASSEIPQVPVIKNPDIPLSRDEPKKGPERPDDTDSGLIEALEEDLEHESKHKKKGK